MPMSAPFLQSITWKQLPADRRQYPLTLPFLQDSQFGIDFTTPITVLVGENATGKSTLLEAIADNCGFHMGGGSRDHFYAAPDAAKSALSQHLRFSWLPKVTKGFFFRADSYVNLARYVDEDLGSLHLYGDRPLIQQSHGESFLALFENRLQAHTQSIFLLDEPESALSPTRQLELLRLLHRWHESGRAQIIIATHSPLIMAYPHATLLYFDRDGLREVNYRATPHFQTLARFFQNPDAMVAEALTEDDGSASESL
jgi:predicted ATPase